MTNVIDRIWKVVIPMFERFTDRARRVIVLTQEVCRTQGVGEIRVEHMVYALLSEGEGVAAQVLKEITTLDAMEAHLWNGTGTPGGHVPFHPTAKKAIELALREALQLGHNYIGTEHLLLAVNRPEIRYDTVDAMLVEDEREIRRAVISKLSGYDPPDVSPLEVTLSDILNALGEVVAALAIYVRNHES